MKHLMSLIAANFIVTVSTVGVAHAQKQQCTVYCNDLCQKRVASGLTQPRSLPSCISACISQNRGGMGGKNTTVAYGKCL